MYKWLTSQSQFWCLTQPPSFSCSPSTTPPPPPQVPEGFNAQLCVLVEAFPPQDTEGAPGTKYQKKLKVGSFSISISLALSPSFSLFFFVQDFHIVCLAPHHVCTPLLSKNLLQLPGRNVQFPRSLLLLLDCADAQAAGAGASLPGGHVYRLDRRRGPGRGSTRTPRPGRGSAGL